MEENKEDDNSVFERCERISLYSNTSIDSDPIASYFKLRSQLKKEAQKNEKENVDLHKANEIIKERSMLDKNGKLSVGEIKKNKRSTEFVCLKEMNQNLEQNKTDQMTQENYKYLLNERSTLAEKRTESERNKISAETISFRDVDPNLEKNRELAQRTLERCRLLLNEDLTSGAKSQQLSADSTTGPKSVLNCIPDYLLEKCLTPESEREMSSDIGSVDHSNTPINTNSGFQDLRATFTKRQLFDGASNDLSRSVASTSCGFQSWEAAVVQFEQDEKEMLNGSNVIAHDSLISHFSGLLSGEININSPSKGHNANISIGEYFKLRSANIDGEPIISTSETKDCNAVETGSASSGNTEMTKTSTISNTTSVIQHLISQLDSDTSANELMDKLLGLENLSLNIPHNTTQNQIDKLSDSRKSTPVANRSKKQPQAGLARRLISKNFETNGNPSTISSTSTPKTHLTRNQSRNEKLSTGTYSVSSKSKSETIVVDIEESIADGDLTILSKRVEGLEDDGVCVLRPEGVDEVDLVVVIRELSALPNGTVDCSSLVPLLRDQFPELLSNLPECLDKDSLDASNYSELPDGVIFAAGSWVNLPSKLGYKESLACYVGVSKEILLPVANVTDKWVLCTFDNIYIGESKRKLKALKQHDTNEWTVLDYLVVKVKDFILPPNVSKDIKMSVKTRLSTPLHVRLDYTLTDMIQKDTQKFDLQLNISGHNPVESLSVSPSDLLDFGLIPDNCWLSKKLTVANIGRMNMPIRVYIEQEESNLDSFTFLTPDDKQRRTSYQKQLNVDNKLVLTVVYDPPALQQLKSGPVCVHEGYLIIELGMNTDEGYLYRIPLCATVSHAKFLYVSGLNPIVIESVGPGHSGSRDFPLKSVGSIPVTLSCVVQYKNTDVVDDSDVFSVPSTFNIPSNSSSLLPIKFSPVSNDALTERVLSIRLVPNGKIVYRLELHGVITQLQPRPSSKMSTHSAVTSTSSSSLGTQQVVKISASKLAVSWPSVNAKKEMLQHFHIKNSSDVKAVLRISFKHPSDVFHFCNEEGEYLTKMKKPLKPGGVHELKVVFRPQTPGVHVNQIHVETNSLSRKSMIMLNAHGGSSKLILQNLSTDSNGHKLMILNHSQDESHYFHCEFIVANTGNIPGFVYVKPTRKVPTLTNPMKVTPTSVVVEPMSQFRFKVSQRMKREELKALTKGSGIANVETLSLLMGDEVNRQRLRKCVNSGTFSTDELITCLVSNFYDETRLDVSQYQDDKDFRSVFFKSVKCVDVSAVIETNLDDDSMDSTLVENGNDTTVMFTTMLNAPDVTITQNNPTDTRNEQLAKKKLVTKWLNDLTS